MSTGWFAVRAALCSMLLAVFAAPALAAVSSGSVLGDAAGRFLYTANIDAGSISRVSLADPRQVLEQPLGKDIRNLALAEQARVLLATGYVDDRVWLLDATSLKIKQSVPLSYRPYGAVFDSANRWFWVTLYESAELVALSLDGEVLQRIKTADSPRGLALLSDGRLLISHAMIGAVSVLDTRINPAKTLQTITLGTETHADALVSQGLPRLLDDIAVDADESEVWLPHVLWSFGHPFQFQSTVFPAVSVLEIDNEKPRDQAISENLSWRKQLFKQINLQDVRNRTQIVSNPQDATFPPDGNRVYVSLAGSDDVLVFDRARARSDTSKKRRSRRVGKLDQGGAQAVQLVREYPGQNPRGLWLQGEHLLVQNAQSKTLTRLATGGASSFARVTVADAVFATLGSHDRLTAEQRQGARLFNLGNTQENAAFPMAGDFWMSCNSCHQDGFNFTNRFLMQAHQQNAADNAIIGHARLKSMIGQGFIGDYIRLIQDTQGGLGHDTRDGATLVDPEAPPAEVVQRMNALHAYVRLPENLPLVSTWLRIDDKKPFLHPQEWISSAACAGCHKDMFDQWADSNHRLMGESNPYYRVLEDVAAQTEGEIFRTWCVGCHNPQRVSAGLPFRGQDNHMFEKGGEQLKQRFKSRQDDLDEGTGCLFCHRISKVEDAGGNAAFTVNLKDRETSIGETSSMPMVRWFAERQINAKPEVHAQSYSQPIYKDPVYCKGCHDEFSPGHGAKIVSTYAEWEASSFNNPQDPAKNRTCISCHMHADISRIGEDVPGISTEGGRTKANVVTHQFTGANHHLVGLRNPELEAMSIALLKTSARLSQRLEAGELVVRVENVGAGHALPTGVADFRQLWLAIRVEDAAGKLLLQTGEPDAQGHLPNDTRLFMKVFGNAQGKPVDLIFWRYAKLLSDTRIPADGFRDERFALPAGISWPIKVITKLNFRIYPQWVTDAVRKRVPQLPEPPVVELNRIESAWGQADDR